jgi:hypothetical protein
MSPRSSAEFHEVGRQSVRAGQLGQGLRLRPASCGASAVALRDSAFAEASADKMARRDGGTRLRRATARQARGRGPVEKRRWRGRTPRPAGIPDARCEREASWESGAGARALQDLPASRTRGGNAKCRGVRNASCALAVKPALSTDLKDFVSHSAGRERGFCVVNNVAASFNNRVVTMRHCRSLLLHYD